MNPFNYELTDQTLRTITRRHFFGRCAAGIGSVALASLLNEKLLATDTPLSAINPLAPRIPHFAPKARRAIYLHMAGAPSTLDLFDYKPKLQVNRAASKKQIPISNWQSVGSRTYFLERSTNLGGLPAFLPWRSNLVGQAGTASYTDTNVIGAGPVFYRVGVE